jgi:hypothetical protein
MFPFRLYVLTALLIPLTVLPAAAQERPYFVTYDHYLEERGSLEIAFATTTGVPKRADRVYTAPWLEIEYGVTGWWTAELYLEGVTARGERGAFTGWRFENRFRPFRDERRINPVLYVEYENINEATRIQKEIVGAGRVHFEPIAELRREPAHELEGKLILSSVVGPWNLSENFVFEKNLSASEGVEFGYSVGAARSLGALAGGRSCRFCAENFVVGVEAYGGLGSTVAFEGAEQRHYVAPVIGWHVADRTTVKASAGFGLTANSDRYLLRFGFSYELPTRRGR